MKVIKKISMLLVIVLLSFVIISCNKTNKKLGNDTYLELRYERNEENENNFILVLEKLEYITIKNYTSKTLYRNENDNNNPYRASVYYRYYDEATNTYKDEFIGKYEMFSIRYNVMFSIKYLIQANEIPSKYKLVKGRVYN